jgi:hypothetical protein
MDETSLTQNKMKRITVILCLIMLFFTGFTINAKAQQQQNQTSILTQSENPQNDSLTTFYIVTSKLNVRAAANANAKTLGQLDVGDFLEVIEAGPKWLKIQYQETTGYVSADYVKVVQKERPVTSIKQLTMKQKMILTFIAAGLALMLVVMLISLFRPKRFKPISDNDMLINRTRQLGMVAAPGSSKQINSSVEKRNELAYEYLENAFNAWSVVKTEGSEEFRKPTSFKQVRNSIKWINQAIAMGPSEKVLVERINELGAVINDNEKRIFQGSKRLLIFVGIIGAIIFYLIYRSNDVSKAFIGASIYWSFGLLYFIASMTPVWLAEKKKFAGSVNSGFMNFASNLQDMDRTWNVKWSDGTTTKESEYGGCLMSVIVMFVVFTVNIVLIPLRVLINFFRNYVLYI